MTLNYAVLNKKNVQNYQEYLPKKSKSLKFSQRKFPTLKYSSNQAELQELPPNLFVLIDTQEEIFEHGTSGIIIIIDSFFPLSSVSNR